MKTTKLLLSGLLLLTPFLSNSLDWDNVYTNHLEQTIEITQEKRHQEEQGNMVIPENVSNSGFEIIVANNRTVVNQTTNYKVIILPVKINQSGVTELLVKLLGPNQKDKVQFLVKNGGTVAQDLSKKEAESIKRTLETAGAKVRIEEMTSSEPETNKLFLGRLVSVGTHELNVVKMVHELTELGLKESKEVVDKLGVVAENLSKKEAESIKRMLEAVGAKVRVEKMPSSDSQSQLETDTKDNKPNLSPSNKPNKENKRAIALPSELPGEKEKKGRLSKSGKHHNVKPVDKHPKVIASDKHHSNSEYNQLVTKMNHHLQVKTNADLRMKLTTLKKGTKQQNNREITRLAKKTGWDANYISMMAMAEEESAKTGLPAQLYYAIYREAPAGETTISLDVPDFMKRTWEKAIKDNIIDASFESQLNTYLQKFAQQKQIPLPKDLPGRTRN